MKKTLKNAFENDPLGSKETSLNQNVFVHHN